MIVNRHRLLEAAPIVNMLTTKERAHGVSHGLAEVGYDIRIKQDIRFKPATFWRGPRIWVDGVKVKGRFTLASSMEDFDMPDDLTGIVHDKSTWIRRSVSVFNTVIEPGWGPHPDRPEDGCFLTLELAFHGEQEVHIPAGAGIAQVIFHRVEIPTRYKGKYQGQADRPVAAIHEES